MLLGVLLLGGGAALAAPPQAPSQTWVVSGPLWRTETPSLAALAQVNAVAVSGTTAYVGGDFRYVGPETGGFVALDAVDRQRHRPLAGRDRVRQVGRLRTAPAAGSSPGASPRSAGCRGRTSRTCSPTARSTRSSPRRSTAPPTRSRSRGRRSTSAGTFTTANGSPRSRGGRVRRDERRAARVGSRAVSAAYVYALAVSGSTVYLGGMIQRLERRRGPSRRARRGRRDDRRRAGLEPRRGGPGLRDRRHRDRPSTRSELRLRERRDAAQPCGRVRPHDRRRDRLEPESRRHGAWAVAVDGGNVYVGGDFTAVNGGTARSGVARVDAATRRRDELEPERAPATSFSLAVSGSNVIAGGRFTQVTAPPPATTSRSSMRPRAPRRRSPRSSAATCWSLATSGLDGVRRRRLPERRRRAPPFARGVRPEQRPRDELGAGARLPRAGPGRRARGVRLRGVRGRLPRARCPRPARPATRRVRPHDGAAAAWNPNMASRRARRRRSPSSGSTSTRAASSRR